MDNVFVIKWVGPFKEIEDLRKWEKENTIPHQCNFYIITGKEKGKHNYSEYCGITDNQNGYIYCRFYDKGHHVYKLIRDRNIWIGYIDNKNKYTRNDIELCETMLISHWQPIQNIKKKSYYPSQPVVIINRWFDLSQQCRIKSLYHVQKSLSDVIIYDERNRGIFGVEKLKKLRNIN
ncbi:MAG: hypothetical protein IJ321_01230 [Alistipes sp.]|uniref:hypothetical protein n=1 Tax=Alistipes sp. TaxID=1872444 RepID=UPI0023F0F2B8|nr:hypothetical protein [Alistipes sp.]MBQ7892546.1 hypothetical protein [Alistipes sp.]